MQEAAVAPRHRWRLRGEEPTRRNLLAARGDLHPVVADLLARRGVAPEELRDFLDASLHHLPDPSSLPDLDAAVAALERARSAGRRVLVHGDYDVDGTCGAVLLHFLLERLGIDVEVHVPDRIADGYSFSERSLRKAEELDVGLVVAVDNGTTAYPALEHFAARGVEVVVVDHHPLGPTRPPCAALVNPWCAPGAGTPDGPFAHFSGAAMAWFLAWGALRSLRGPELDAADRRFLVDALGLAAIATVADVMPLRGPNRAIVRQGLKTLEDSGLPGVRALVAAAGVRGEPTAGDVGFRLGPRLNAAGRMGRAELAFQALAARSRREAEEACAALDALNRERQEATERELRRFAPRVEERLRAGDRVLVVGDEDAPFGIMGIVAGKLCEDTGLPSLAWAGCGDGVARGSARAPEGVDLVALLDGASDLLRGYGGHARAAGFEFDPARADVLEARLREHAAALPPPPEPEIVVDAELHPGECDLALARALEGLAPFGEGFPEPLFLVSDLELVAPPRPLGDGSHLELRLGRDGAVVRTLAWRAAERLAGLRQGDRIDAVVRVGVNRFRGREDVEWTLQDLRTPA